MFSKRLLALALVVLFGAGASAGDVVEVSGSNIKYDTPIVSMIGEQQAKLALTGVALRKKYFFNVYTIGSYVQEGVKVETAEELAAMDCPKQLHLIMERDVTGKEMAEAFKAGIRQNHDAPEFDHELDLLIETFSQHAIKKGDHVWLTHIPKVGVICSLSGKCELTIKNAGFSQAVWEIYLGKRNIGDAIKEGLVSHL